METHVLHLQRTNQSKAGWEGVSFSWLKAPQSRWQRPPVGIVFTPTLQDENTTACGRQHQHVQVGAFHVPGIRTNQMSIPTPWSWARSALGCCSLCNGRFAVHETHVVGIVDILQEPLSTIIPLILHQHTYTNLFSWVPICGLVVSLSLRMTFPNQQWPRGCWYEDGHESKRHPPIGKLLCTQNITE